MKLRNSMPVILCILVGFFMSNFMFNQYDKEETTSVFSHKNTLYFLQVGVYSSMESMKENLKNVSTYIYEEKDHLYYAYVGMVKEKENLEKVEGYFQSLNYVLYRKEKKVSNAAFLEVLSQYEMMLKETNDPSAIGMIMNEVISKYEELVLNE